MYYVQLYMIRNMISLTIVKVTKTHRSECFLVFVLSSFIKDLISEEQCTLLHT